MVEVLLVAPRELVESVSDALMNELNAMSVSVEDADANTDAEQPLFGEPGMPALQGGWQRSMLKALFNNAAEATEATTLLLAQDWAQDVHLNSIETVADQDWVRLTQSQFTPVEITPTFWIVPSWHEPPEQALRVIRLDPGLAFGTGTHPTTRMCLRWIANQMAQRPSAWARVLDYGCGSGILAIGAALHGAKMIDAVDIDPSAIETTRANAQANGVIVAAGTPEIANGQYPLVLANILAAPLKLLAPLLCSHLNDNGQLVLAGILEGQAKDLKLAYAPWCKLEVSDMDQGWILMTATCAT